MAKKITWFFYAVDYVLRKKIGIYGKKKKYSKLPELSISEASDYIADGINSGKPFMAGRFGFFELAAMRMYEFGKKDKYEIVINNIYNCAGFFPNDISLGNRFNEVMVSALKRTDMLALTTQLCENYFINRYMEDNAATVKSFDVYDVCRDESNWTSALEGKKVLVVSPFTDSIISQYEKRERLFSGRNVLPQMHLLTYKSLLTIGDIKDDRFNNWFEALDFMAEEIMKIDFDVALLGCGAYGFALAARIKDSGRQAVHMGGALQLLFGIMGRRWDGSRFGGKEYMEPHIARYYNEDWTYPIEERPKEADKVEYGPYWQ